MENNNNLPARVEEPKEISLFEQIKDEAMMGVIESILPKLKPMIDPTMKKLEDYFGNNEKIFMIRRSAEQTPKVIVLSNLTGNYHISNDIFEMYNPANPMNEETLEEFEERIINDITAQYDLERDAKIAMFKAGSIKHSIFRATKDNIETGIKGAIIDVYDSGDWVEKLLTGEFTKS